MIYSAVVDLYKYGRFDDGVNQAVIDAMQENIESDNSYVPQYCLGPCPYHNCKKITDGQNLTVQIHIKTCPL